MRALLTLLLMALVPTGAGAQPVPDSLRVEDALARLARHPLVQAAEARAAAQQASARGVTAWAAPSLLYAREGMGARGDFAEQRVVAGVAWGPAGVARAERARLRAAGQAYTWEAEAGRRELRARTIAAYVELALADALVALRAEATLLADSLVGVARLREESGEAAGLETLRAELEAEQARAAVAAAAVQREAARGAVGVVLGVEGSVCPVAPPLRVPPFSALPPAPEDALPAVRAAAARADAAAAAVQAARAAWQPTWSAEVFPQYYGGGQQGWGVQVGVHLPLLQGRMLAARRQAARAESGAAAAERDQALRASEAARNAAIARVGAARAALETAEAGPAARADALLALMVRGYRLGEVPLAALLDARRAALQARETLLAARAEVLRSLAEWERATGATVLFPVPPP